jgi:glucose-1-phosphate adenylyltransferase
LTISAVPVLRSRAANNFGVLVVDSEGRLLDFQEKPADPASMPGRPEYCLASMGNYTFRPDVLLKVLEKDAQKETIEKRVIQDRPQTYSPDEYSTHDFGFDVIPDMLRNNRVRIFVYDFTRNLVKGSVEGERGFWRDIGDLDEFFRTNMMMRDVVPPINIYNAQWPIHTFVEMMQPPKTVGNGSIDSIVGNGSIVSNSNIHGSVLSYGVNAEEADILDSVLLGYIEVGPRTKIRKSIIDRGTPQRKLVIPPGTEIGYDKELDEMRGFTISEEGVTTVPRNTLKHPIDFSLR